MPIEKLHRQTPETLKKAADALAGIAARIRTVAEAMPSDNLDELQMTHQDSLRTGMRSLEGFASALSAAVMQALDARGDFGNGTPPKRGRKGR